MILTILYRGSLSSCNYSCDYCPFAKTKNTRAELKQDAQELERFVSWVSEQSRPIRLLFTPWGEGLIRKHYQRALVDLSRMKHVERVAIQTNLSAPLTWVREANAEILAFWATFHPSQTTQTKFVQQCNYLSEAGFRFSVGTVGLKEDLPAIEALRNALPNDVYLWTNAYKRVKNYYGQDHLELLRRLDPLFDLNNQYHESENKACHAGESAISVDGDGNARRCHFVSNVIGNIYETPLASMLKPRTCPNATCGCYIGYMHLNHLELEKVYGNGLLPRIPTVTT